MIGNRSTSRIFRCVAALVAAAQLAITSAAAHESSAPPDRVTPRRDPSPQTPSLTLRVSDVQEPSILDERSLDRGQPDFVPLPGVTVQDEYFPPLLWPVDPPLGYTGPSG